MFSEPYQAINVKRLPFTLCFTGAVLFDNIVGVMFLHVSA